MGYIQNPQEIHEAIHAADEALEALHRADNCLSSAGNWGILDMLGGDFFASLFKHNKLSQAQQALEDAKHALRHFKSELADVHRTADIELDIGEFLSFADFFFDGLVADWMVQSKIRKGQKQMRQAIAYVDGIRSRLWEMLG